MKKNTETTEIARLKKTVAELRQTICSLKSSNEAQLRQIGENIPEGGFYQMVHNPDGRRYCTYVSESFERLWQVEIDKIKKDVTVLYNLIVPDYLEPLAQMEQQSIEQLDQFNFEAPALLPAARGRCGTCGL